MEIKFTERSNITENQRNDLKIIFEICFAGASGGDNAYDWGTVETGKFILYDGEKIVGQVDVHKRLTDYEGREFFLGGPGGLAIMPGYRGKGFARALTECAIQKSREIGVDVACLCVNRDDGVHKFYEKLGYVFLNRDAYYINGLGIEKTDDSVMIKGINHTELAEKILKTKYKFHYGKEHGYW